MVNLASKRRLKEEMIKGFFYGQNFQNKKGNRLDLQGHSVYRTCHKNYRYPPGMNPRLGCKKGGEKEKKKATITD